MASRAELYNLLGQLLSYPREEYPGLVARCRELLRREIPEAAGPLDTFADRVNGMDLEELEELFTRTFDLNPVCCLEVGWHLYGEDYNRGAFMVKMRQLLRSHGVKETIELPDHLSHLLPLFGRLDEQEAMRLSGSFVLPALKKMEEGLSGKNNPYEEVLRVVLRLVEVPALDSAGSRQDQTEISRKEK